VSIALVDMDGTLANFMGALVAQLELLRSPGEPLLDLTSNDEDDPPWLKARKRLIKSRPGFWRNLERIEAGFEMVDVLRHLGYKIHVLTRGPANNSIAWSEKLDWVREHLGDTSVTITLDKGLVYGRVLVDDYPEYALSWLKHRPRGKVIMPSQPWNVGFEHPQVIRMPENPLQLPFSEWQTLLGTVTTED